MTFFFITFQQIFSLFLIILLGYLSVRFGLIQANVKKTLSGILLNLVIPAVIINSFQAEHDLSKAGTLAESMLLAVFVHALLIGLSALLIGKKHPDYRIERLCCIYSNAGFIGIPLLGALFGEVGSFYASIYLTVLNVFLWTQGAFSLTAGADFKESLRKLFSPTLVAVAAALCLYIFRIQLPTLLILPIRYLADMNAPFAMIVTGVSIATCNPRDLLHPRVFYVSALRQIVLPLILLLLFRAFGLTNTTAVCTLIAASCPTAAAIPMLALQYDQNEQTASGTFALTTLLSLVTIPFFMLFI